MHMLNSFLSSLLTGIAVYVVCALVTVQFKSYQVTRKSTEQIFATSLIGALVSVVGMFYFEGSYTTYSYYVFTICVIGVSSSLVYLKYLSGKENPPIV